ncbi:hypothetical protein MFLAVUS_007651 [Mucor flavus]|uniref:Uncharacterized protein n=1 Tax=Mucor flavus TaxID=439312 RepID=A0ABP9Z4W4_9FUNG
MTFSHIFKREKTLFDELSDEAFGYLKRVIVTPAVYSRLVEFPCFDIPMEWDLLVAESVFYLPKKRKFTYVEDSKITPPLSSIRNIVLDSYCKSLLYESGYVELDEKVASLLNWSWTSCPLMLKITATLLEEAILMDGLKSLLILEGEIYSRVPTLDGPYEKFDSIKNTFPESSLPRVNTRYENLEVHVINDDNAKKLILGTKL